jgi:hypothetical protein
MSLQGMPMTRMPITPDGCKNRCNAVHIEAPDATVGARGAPTAQLWRVTLGFQWSRTCLEDASKMGWRWSLRWDNE